MTRYLFIAVFALLCALTISLRSCREIRQERDRLSANQSGLMEGITYYRTRDSLSAASVERLNLTNREFKRYCSNLLKTVDALNIKVRRLQSVSQSATETKYIVKTILRDSIIPGRTDTLRCMDYRNDYLTLSGCMSGGTFTGVVESRDTIGQVIHRIPRRLWFIRFGCKAIRQEVISRNPHSRIAYTEYIELNK